MYYIWSLIASLILFSAIQYTEYRKNTYTYKIATPVNVATFVMIYIIFTVIFYMMFNINYKTMKRKHTGGMYADPSMLRKIVDKVDIGFNPHDSLNSI